MNERVKLIQFLCLTCGLQGMKPWDLEINKGKDSLLCPRCGSSIISTTKLSGVNLYPVPTLGA